MSETYKVLIPRKYKIIKEEQISKCDKKENFDDPVSLNSCVLISSIKISEASQDKAAADEVVVDSEEDDDLLYRVFVIAKRKPKRVKKEFMVV